MFQQRDNETQMSPGDPIVLVISIQKSFACDSPIRVNTSTQRRQLPWSDVKSSRTEKCQFNSLHLNITRLSIKEVG